MLHSELVCMDENTGSTTIGCVTWESSLITHMIREVLQCAFASTKFTKYVHLERKGEMRQGNIILHAMFYFLTKKRKVSSIY